MADFGAPVAQNVNSGQGIQTLSGILGLRQQQLGIQQQTQALQGQAAQVQQEQQTAQQRSGIAAVMANFDPTKHVGPDGTLDLDSVLTDPKLRAAAGDQFPQIMQQMVQVKQSQLQAKQQLANLNDSLRNQFSSVVGSLRTDPDVLADNPAGRAKVQQAMGNFAQSGGPDAARVANTYANAINATPQGKLAQVVSNTQSQAMDASAQAGRQAPIYLGAGSQAVNVNPQAAGANVAAPAKPVVMGIPPGRAPYTDVYGQTFTFNPQSGNYEPAGKGGGNASGPGSSSPGAAEATRAQAEQNFANVNANRAAGNLAPQQLDQIRNALQISQTVSTGGDWTEKRAQVEANLSSVFPGLAKAQDDASKIQVLDKFLTRVTNDSNKVLGQNASTDAQRDSIAHQNAQIGFTPPAIQSVLKYGEAQTMAMQAKANAQDAWLKKPGHGITNQHDFETQWRNAYDPILFQLEAGSPADRVKLIQSLPPQEAQSLAGKRAALKDLGVNLP